MLKLTKKLIDIKVPQYRKRQLQIKSAIFIQKHIRTSKWFHQQKKQNKFMVNFNTKTAILMFAKMNKITTRIKALGVTCFFLYNACSLIKLKKSFIDFNINIRNIQKRLRSHFKWKQDWFNSLDNMWHREIQIIEQ